MYRKAIRILEAKIGIATNQKVLLPQIPQKIEVKSLLTDFNDVQEIPYSFGLDGYISVKEQKIQKTSIEFSGKNLKLRGSFHKLTKEASDLRFSLWGNQGLLFRYVLFLLETKHQVFSIHGCALHQAKNNRLYLIAGGAGSGKTVFLLSGLERGLKLFSTELVHFRIKKGSLEWFRGSLVDNVRIGTLKHNFPHLCSDIRLTEKKDEWQEKIALDLAAYKTDKETINNPELVVIFPRIEEGRRGFYLSAIEERNKTIKFIFDNISQKLTETVILYDKIPFVGFENKRMPQARLNTVNELVQHKTITKVAFVLTNPYECWGNLLE